MTTAEETTIQAPAEEAPIPNSNGVGKKSPRRPRGPRRKPHKPAHGNAPTGANENGKEPLQETKNSNNSNVIGDEKNARRPSRKSQPNKKNKKRAVLTTKKNNDMGNVMVDKDPVSASVQKDASTAVPVPPPPLPDDKLPASLKPDPRNNKKRITNKAAKRGTGRNTESFDPASTWVRPDVRIWVGSNTIQSFDKKLKHDDVVIVPELFGKEDDWSLYYKLLEEVTAIQQQQQQENVDKNTIKKSASHEWISWHEGAHLIVKEPPLQSKAFSEIVDRLCQYFHIRKESIGLRFNWYRDSSDWKPFHHDSAAFNAQRAKDQNITVGVSFGAMRELAFLRAAGEQKCRLYFPQPNNGVFSFGRDVNIKWKHGINALKDEEQDGKGRISIVLWGLAGDIMEEAGSPPLLGSDGTGPHAAFDKKRGQGRTNQRNKNGRGGKNKKNKASESVPSEAENTAETNLNATSSDPTNKTN